MEELKLLKLSTEWVERIFKRLQSIYGDRWTDYYENTPDTKHLYTTIWSTGLYGLTSAEIKHALTICQSLVNKSLPNHLEFYHYAKSLHKPTASEDVIRGDPELAKAYINEIRQKLTGKMLINE
jgi:hypothetical protein